MLFQCAVPVCPGQPFVSPDRTAYNPGETVNISINTISANLSAFVTGPPGPFPPSLTELTLIPAAGGYRAEYAPQQGVVLGTYTVLVTGDEINESANFDIRALSLSLALEDYYPLEGRSPPSSPISISGKLTDCLTESPVNASVRLTENGVFLGQARTDPEAGGLFSINYTPFSPGLKALLLTALDAEGIAGSASAGFEVYSSSSGNLSIGTSKESCEAGEKLDINVSSLAGEPAVRVYDPLGNIMNLTVHEKQGSYWSRLQLNRSVILGEYWAEALVNNGFFTESVKIPFDVVAPSSSNGPELSVSYSRLLSGLKVGQHKVPPIVNVGIEITAEPSSPVQNATLIDHYPEGWIIQDGNGGTVDTGNHSISWNLGPLLTEAGVSRSYTIFSPRRTLPPTTYGFTPELVYDGGSETGEVWKVIVSDPTTVRSELRSPSADTGDYWQNPEGAYLDGGDYASTSDSGCKHIYSGYGFDIPEDASIISVRVRMDAWCYDSGKKIKLYLSKNRGKSWVKNVVLTTSNVETAYWVDASSWTSWTPQIINNDMIKTEVESKVKGGTYLDWIPVEVNYTVESSLLTRDLELGEGVKGEGRLTGVTNITSICDNSNVSVEFVSGDSGRFSHNWTTCDMADLETKVLGFSCNDSENGDFSATFRVSSADAAETKLINVSATIFSYAALSVSMDRPIDGLVVNPGDTFTVNATVTCTGETGARPGTVFALARYGSFLPDTPINTTIGATPFFVTDTDGGGGANFTETHYISTTANGSSSVHAADLDGDGDMDVLSAAPLNHTVAWYENLGNRSFTEHNISTECGNVQQVYAVDLDRDGDMDVLATAREYVINNGCRIFWYENLGNRSFSTHEVAFSNDDQDRPWSVYAADLDGDGDIDIIGGWLLTDIIRWYKNDGNEGFTQYSVSTSTDSTPRVVYAADIDKDGDMDILTALSNDDTVVYYRNNGYGSFTRRVIARGIDGVYWAYATDVDGDGDWDALSASWNDDRVVWYENNGHQAFAPHDISATADGANSVYAIDLDQDGDVDVLSASWNDDRVVWYENDGNETFSSHNISTTADGADSVYAADLDGDGDTDVLSASYVDDTVAWYENTAPPPLPSNPKTCPVSLSPGESWNVSWTINVTGEVGSRYELDVLFTSSYGASLVPAGNTQDSTVIIGHRNRPPVLSEIGPRTGNESEPLTIPLAANDPDGDPIVYGTNTTFGNLTGNVFSWTPGLSDSGVYYVEFNASDGLLNDSEAVTITVNESYMNFSVSKRVEPGAYPDNFTVTLALTSHVDFNATGVRAYDLIPASFAMTDPVPVYSGSQKNIYYWTTDLSAGESKTVTYTLKGSGTYALGDAFTVGVDPQ